ncbi:MAG: hypothetical protein EOP84_02435 [Verrucomicrobiaceae bacterium]|nr:MAG: hypothetical protein EOP84_02435 [Verrucomicrobiaceae bacterium]
MGKVSLVLTLVLFLQVIPASARLGETKEQLIVRYGEPIKPIKPVADRGRIIAHVMYFRFNGFLVDATLFDGVCHGEDFHFTSEPQRIAVLPAILEANAGGKQWVVDKPGSWGREDRQVSGMLSADGLHFFMWTFRMLDWVYRGMTPAQEVQKGL